MDVVVVPYGIIERYYYTHYERTRYALCDYYLLLKVLKSSLVIARSLFFFFVTVILFRYYKGTQ